MSEEIVAKDKAVYVTYSIIDQSGNVFEQSDLPIGYVHGAESGLFEKVEEALNGRKVGDKVEVILTPEEGFGYSDPQLVYTDDLDNVPQEYRHVGAKVEFQNDSGDVMEFTVTGIENGTITIDANPPLAGQTVKFVVTVAMIRNATLDEIVSGRPDAPQGSAQIH
jgi:FKBP-type peptidyl-prolyl cis-trans isomerase SlyD